MPLRLGVNVDHVATLRQSRRTQYPDPVQAAAMAELAGADQITVHLREDRRHVQERDVEILRRTVQTRLNLEMAASLELARFAAALRPDVCTLVPERRQELTTEGGLDLIAQRHSVGEVVRALRGAGIAISVFIDPEPAQLEEARRLGVEAVELHTGRYAEAPRGGEAGELARLADAAAAGAKLGLAVAAGHGLHYGNTAPVAAVPQLEELNIGHAIVARAVLVGMERAVREMKRLMERARP